MGNKGQIVQRMYKEINIEVFLSLPITKPVNSALA